LTALLPFAALLLPQSTGGQSAPAVPAASQPQPSAASPSGETVSLLDEATGEVLTVPVEQYLIGAVAAELPADYQPEALKAQAVASHSYLLACREANQQKEELKGAWLAVNTKARQGYVTDEVLRAMWGDAYEENYAKFSQALSGLAKQVLTYDGKPALACYHAISRGQTESSENVWGQPLPYLVSVDSSYDLTADGYLDTVTYTPQEMSDMLSVNFIGADLSGAPAEWFGEPVRTEAGYVKELPV
ncbi:MAG: SpoIID/LytB domain-containing protein, partial [Oscillospiraceae bacterium]|nr:SpoIID/LytB domain-containing protein [Oscillospiraceae bacterium]